MRPERAAAPLVAALVWLVTANTAHAQPTDLAAAEALFEQGRQELAAGRIDAACTKFAESHRLAPAAGTALNLGNCYEKQKKYASAWGAFSEALALSRGTNQQERAELARTRAAALEPKLSRLTVVVPPESEVQGLEVRRDGVSMTRAQWGTAIPVDPGTHTIEATATDKVPFRKTITITTEGETTTFKLAPLADAQPAPAPAKATPEAPVAPVKKSGSGSTLRLVGIGTAVLGAGLIGAGAAFGLSSASKSDELEAHARSGGAWGPEQTSTFDDGESAATIANVLFVSGAIVLVTGGVLTVLGFTAKAPSATAVAPSGTGLRCTF